MALKWVEALPRDWRPLLHLAESAEERGAFTKALKYIGEAEQLGGRDSQAGRARMRLLVAKAVRHLRQRRGDLAEKDFSDIKRLPQSTEQDRPAYCASLEWVRALKAGDRTGATGWTEKVCDLVGGRLPGNLLLNSVARQCGLVSKETLELSKWLSAFKKKELIQALIRLGPVSNDMRFEIIMPDRWEDRLAKWFKGSNCSLDPQQLWIIAETAYAAGLMEVAYHCCRHGLGDGNPNQARFMFLRAKSLPGYSIDRKESCYATALALARRARNMDLVSEIIDTRRKAIGRTGWGLLGSGMPDIVDSGLDDDALNRIMKVERKQKNYPTYSSFYREPVDQCNCPACRRKRGERETRARKTGKRRKSASPNTAQGRLFDDPIEREDGGAPEVFEKEGLPLEMIEVLADLVRLNNGRRPNESDFKRLLNRHPEMLDKIDRIVAEFMSDDAAPFEASQGDTTDPRSRRGRRKPKKRKR